MASEEFATLQANLERLQVPPAAAAQIGNHTPRDCGLGYLENGEPQLIFRDRSIYAGDEPQVVSASQARDLVSDQQPDLVVFFGLGLGLHARDLRQLVSAPVVIFEPSLDLTAFVLTQVEIDLPEVYLATDEGAFADILGSLLGPEQSDVVAGAIPASRELFPGEFDAFCRIVNDGLQRMASERRTRDRFSVEWVANLAGNLPFLGSYKPVRLLAREFVCKPAILVGAGPSLDRNLADLARAKGKALIVAVHTAVQPLARAGITPDLVVILEGQKLDHFFAGVEHLDEMVLVPSPQTHPAHLQLGFKDFLGVSLDGIAAGDWLAAAYGETPLQAGGSVACAVFSILHELACDPIVLVGMDTAYGDQRGHAAGSQSGCCGVRIDPEKKTATTYCTADVHEQFVYPIEMVTGWGGETQVATRTVLASFRHWFEAAGRTWAADHELINATEGGARFRGFTEMTLAQVLEKYCTEPLPAAALIAAALTEGPRREPAALVKVVSAELGMIQSAGEAAELAGTLAESAIQVLESGQTQSVQPLLNQLATHERQLQDLTRKTRLLNTLVGHRVAELATEKPVGDELARTIHSLKLSRRISEMIVTGAAELLGQFEPVLASMADDGGPA